MTQIEKHFKTTEKLLKAVNKYDIAQWLLNTGYFAEKNILPPPFRSVNFNLQDQVYKLNKPEQLENVSYPKGMLTSRVFSLQHPKYYHNIVYGIIENWDAILKLIFNKGLRFYSYSMPISVSANNDSKTGGLRAGRLVYEWLSFAEKDIITEAHNYTYVIKADIANFYNSIYTHSIAWALHGKEEARKDKNLFGNILDTRICNANDRKTNGIPVGSALSDLIAEIILSRVDLNTSNELKKLDFLASRFKDDYRILCKTKEDANTILKSISKNLAAFNLMLNESKTSVNEIPNGLYRNHDKAYYPYSLRYKKEISFKKFEMTLLKVLEIHKEYPGTSIVEKFLSELFDKSYNLKILANTANRYEISDIQIKKAISLLIILKRSSEKSINLILAVFQAIINRYSEIFNWLIPLFKDVLTHEIIKANKNKSVFELIWLVFFAKYMKIEGINFEEIITTTSNLENNLLQSILQNKQHFFTNSSIQLFDADIYNTDINFAKEFNIFYDKQKESSLKLEILFTL